MSVIIATSSESVEKLECSTSPRLNIAITSHTKDSSLTDFFSWTASVEGENGEDEVEAEWVAVPYQSAATRRGLDRVQFGPARP